MPAFGSLPSGSIAFPSAGKLRVSFVGKFSGFSNSSPGFPSSSVSANIGIRLYVGPVGVLTYGPIMDKYNAGTSQLELDYPGGNVSWSVGVQEVAVQTPTSGIYSFYWENMIVTCVLLKR